MERPHSRAMRGGDLQTHAGSVNVVKDLCLTKSEEKTMKRYVFLGLLILFMLPAGCLNVPFVKSSPAKTEQGLYTKVPAAMRGSVREAEYDLKEAKVQADLATEKVKLAAMRKDTAILEKNYADLEMKMAETLVKAAELGLERKKLEAVDNSNLGDREENIKRIANLKKQELNVESEGVQLKAELDILEMKIKKLAKEMNIQQAKIR